MPRELEKYIIIFMRESVTWNYVKKLLKNINLFKACLALEAEVIYEDSCGNSRSCRCKSWLPVTASTLAHPMRRKILVATRQRSYSTWSRARGKRSKFLERL